MKAVAAFVVLFAVSYVECRKMVPIDKNANIAFINMEGGGAPRPGSSRPAPVPAPGPAAGPLQSKPAVPAPAPVPAKAPAPVNPAPVNAAPAKPTPAPVKPQPPQIQPKPVNPPPAAKPVTTPGPGTVKQLVNFYDSQGNASPIRPYSYSQAVKQGKQG